MFRNLFFMFRNLFLFSKKFWFSNTLLYARAIIIFIFVCASFGPEPLAGLYQAANAAHLLFVKTVLLLIFSIFVRSAAHCVGSPEGRTAGQKRPSEDDDSQSSASPTKRRRSSSASEEETPPPGRTDNMSASEMPSSAVAADAAADVPPSFARSFVSPRAGWDLTTNLSTPPGGGHAITEARSIDRADTPQAPVAADLELSPEAAREQAAVNLVVGAVDAVGLTAEAAVTLTAAVHLAKTAYAFVPGSPISKTTAAAIVGAGSMLSHDGVRSNVREFAQGATRRAYEELQEETDRPPSPRVNFDGSFSSTPAAVSAVADPSPSNRPDAVQSINSAERPTPDSGPDGPSTLDDFAGWSVLESPQIAQADLLYFLTLIALLALFFIAISILILEPSLMRGKVVGHLRSLLGSRVGRLLVLVSLFLVNFVIYILTHAAHFPFYSEPHVVSILKSASTLGNFLSIYIVVPELTLLIDKLFSKQTVSRRGGELVQFFRNFSNSIIYSTISFYIKLVCCLYLAVTFLFFILAVF